MGSNWKTTKLLDHYDIRSGLSKPAKDFGSGYPFLTFKDVFYNYFTPDILGDLVQSNDKERASSSVKRGDVFLTRTSETMHELGMSCVALQDYENSTFNGFCKRLRPHKESELAPEYVGYYLRSSKFRQSMLAFSTMSTRASLNNEMIGRLEISYPSKNEQLKIAKILKTLDDKVALNRQINQTLEQMAQTLFKSWFVDFDPVVDNALDAGFFEQDLAFPDELLRRAEARRTVREHGDFKPLPDATRQLFPAAFEECAEPSVGLGGWVPKGWVANSIGGVSKLVKGKSYKSSELASSDTALVTLKSFQRGGGYRLDGLKPYIGSYKKEQEVSAGDLIIAFTDVTQAADIIGKPAIVISDPCYKKLVISLDVSVVRPNKVSFKYYLYGVAKTLEFQSHTYAHSTGTTVLHLSKNAVPDFIFSSPSDSILERYHEMVSPFFDVIEKNNCSLRTLANLRDTLLPKLISGELCLDKLDANLAQEGVA